MFGGAWERATLACLSDRSSRPRRMPRLLPEREQLRICAARRRTGWRPRLPITFVLASALDDLEGALAAARPLTAAAVRHESSTRRYEWPCPGGLLHMDVSHYARFNRPCRHAHRDRASTAAAKRERVGHDCAHAVVDDHSRLAYAELLDDERADGDRVRRARAQLLRRTRDPTEATDHDNAWSYTLNGSLRELLAELAREWATDSATAPLTAQQH